MASYIYNAAAQDGTAIGAPSTNIPFQPLVDAAGVKYDSLKMNWLPSPAESTTALLVSSLSPVKKVEDMRSRDTAIGAIAPGSPPTIGIGLYNEVLKTKMRPVLGYAGLPSIMLAIERGEVEGYATMPLEILRQSYKHLMEGGKLRVLLQSGETRAPELPDVRAAAELVSNSDDLELLKLGNGFTKTSYPYMMGPGVPTDRLEAMRRAFMETFADPQFREEAAHRDIQIRPVAAEDVTRSIHEGFKTPDATVSRLRNIFERVR
jgi:tripartite-type tricarboxylate transporter receptor subunit TctC